MTEPLAIGIDVGGSKIVAGVVDGDGRVVERLRRSTPAKTTSALAVEDAITDLVAALTGRHEVAVVGVAPAGFVDALRGSVVFAPHLAWRSAPLRDELAARLGLPVFVDNDANAAVWAEWRFGAARGVAHVACVTLGTGIGGALLVDGVLYRGAHGMAGEFGHMVVVPNGLACACGNRGCWERYVSGTALVEAAREQAAGSPRGRRLPTGAGDDPAAPTGPQLAAAAAAGDPAAVALFTQMGGWLGVGLANLAAALDPAMFVVGGGLGEAGEVLLAPAREAFRAALPGRGHRPEVRIVAAVLGNDAGLVGIADLARTVAG